MEEQIPPTPLMEKPVVEAPPEQKTAANASPARACQIIPDPPQAGAGKAQAEADTRRGQEEAERYAGSAADHCSTSAQNALRLQHRRPAAGASRAALSVLQPARSITLATLQAISPEWLCTRSVRHGPVVRIAFTLDRSGRVLSSRLWDRREIKRSMPKRSPWFVVRSHSRHFRPDAETGLDELSARRWRFISARAFSREACFIRQGRRCFDWTHVNAENIRS